jgi:hypothetical protein
MKLNLKYNLFGVLFVVTTSAFAPANNTFTTAEQQQISIATPDLFSRSNTISIDLGILNDNEYSFPLPVGKAELTDNRQALNIKTKEGDVVKAMFAGVVRLSRNVNGYGNVIVIRHDNGLETVYANNAQNLVKVGQKVSAGRSIAIVGSEGGKTYCKFSIMVNGGRINPETVLEVRSHKLRKQTLLCTKNGRYVDVAVKDGSKANKNKKSKKNDIDPENPFENANTFKLNLADMEKEQWAYPLPGSHVISPYGGARHHSGVDIKTKPNDNILAAFDGVVTMSGPFSGYGNCIRIKHKYGFETLYSHQSKNFVKPGDRVKAGQVIGLTGRTGRATTEHLHFEVFFQGRRMNPAVVFDHANKSLQQVTLTLSKNGSVKSERNYYARK